MDQECNKLFCKKCGKELEVINNRCVCQSCNASWDYAEYLDLPAFEIEDDYLLIAYNSSSPKAVIPEGVIEIDSNVFFGMPFLTEVVAPKSLKIIRSDAFTASRNLKTVILNQGLEIIEGLAFSECDSLKEIVIPSSVYNIGTEAFASCEDIAIYLEHEKERAFDDDWHDESAKIIWNCNKKESHADKKDAETKAVAPVKNEENPAKSEKKSVKKVLSITEKENNAQDAIFADADLTIKRGVLIKCNSNVIAVKIPEGVVKIGDNAFENCTNLQTVLIPEGVAEIGKDAFSMCESLLSVNIPSSVTEIGEYAFFCCSALSEIFIPKGVKKIDSYAFENCMDILIYTEYTSKPAGWADGWKMDEVTVFWKSNPATIANIEATYKIKNSRFGNYKGKDKEFTIPAGVKVIEKDAFNANKAIRKIIVSEGVETIEESAFYDCANLNYISLPSTLKQLDFAFQYCKIKDIDLAPNNRYFAIQNDCLYTADFKTLLYCYSAEKKIVLPFGVTKINNCAFFESSAEEIVLPNSVTEIGGGAFNRAKNLKKITLPPKITKINFFTFYMCESLQSIDIPSGVTEIANFAFEACFAITKINLPKSLLKIGKHTFKACRKLQTITIPRSVKEMDEAFSLCNNLTITATQTKESKSWHPKWNGEVKVVWKKDGLFNKLFG